MTNYEKELLLDTAKSAHLAHSLFSGGKLHAGSFETCESMACEDVRKVLELVKTDD